MRVLVCKFMRKSLRSVFIALWVLIFFFSFSFSFPSVSWARSPLEALSARPAESFYMTAQVESLNRLLRKIFSPANVEMLTSLADPGKAETIQLAASLASQIPADTVAFAAGVTADKKPFLQAAASMPESVQAKLRLVAEGKATGVDLVTLLAGEGGALLAGGIQPAVQKGPKGAYYTLGPGVPMVLAARDDLLLIAFSPEDLDASLSAMEDAKQRLVVRRRFQSPNFHQFHADFSTLNALIQSDAGENAPGGGNGESRSQGVIMSERDAAALKAISEMFQAPLEIEIALESKPGSFLISAGVNALEAIKDVASYFKELKPTKGAELFLAGDGKLFLAVSSPMEFRAADWKIYPEFSRVWDEALEELQELGISEKDIEDFLTGSFTFALGSDATFQGRKIPGAYLTLRGQSGAADRVLKLLLENEELKQTIPLAPMKAEGWSSLFMVDPSISPVPVLTGVAGDTFFLGAIDPQGLEKKPQLPPEAEELFETPLIAAGFLDIASVWDCLRQELTSADSPLFDLDRIADQEIKDSIGGLLNAEPSVPFVKTWTSELESSYLEFSIADVPPEKRLFPKLLALAGAADSWRHTGGASAEHSNIVSDLRSMKAASLMFYADNAEEISRGNKVVFGAEQLAVYMDNPNKFKNGRYFAVEEGGHWWVGYDLKAAGTREIIKEKLQSRAEAVGLLGEKNADVPYTGQDIIWMLAR